MKKLNITKEHFEKSRYFQKKYGNLEYVSESGNLFKTDKGKVLMFNEESEEGKNYLGISGTKCIRGQDGLPSVTYRGKTFPERDLWHIAVDVYRGETGRYPRNYDVLKRWLEEDSYRMRAVTKQLWEMTTSDEEGTIRNLCAELEKQRKTPGKGLSIRDAENKLKQAGCKIDELCDEYIGFIHPCGLYVEIDTEIDEDMFTGKPRKLITSIWC